MGVGARLARLNRFVESGGTAVYLEGTGVGFKRGNPNQIRSENIPLDATVQPAQGLWTCVPLLVRALFNLIEWATRGAR